MEGCSWSKILTVNIKGSRRSNIYTKKTVLLKRREDKIPILKGLKDKDKTVILKRVEKTKQ